MPPPPPPPPPTKKKKKKKKKSKAKKWTRVKTGKTKIQPKEREKDWEKFLRKIYYDPSRAGSFQGPEKLYDVVKKEYKGKSPLGLKRIAKWLEKQEVYSLNRPVKRTFQRARVIVSGRFDQFDADLADFQLLKRKNDNFTFILVVIDVFSRYAWAEPILSKSPSSVKRGFEAIFARAGQKPRRLRTDSGKEFTAIMMENYFEEENIEHFVTRNEEIKASYAERLIKTLKSKMWRLMKERKNFRYLDDLQKIVDSYNNTKHSTIQMAPAAVTNGDVSERLWWSQYKPRQPYIKKLASGKRKFKFKEGEHVRISQKAGVFERAYNEKWSTEIFLVQDRFIRDNLKTYKITDLDKQPILGTFYESELQRATLSYDREWEIEKEIETKGNKTLVKWKGWPSQHNSYILTSDLKNYQ